MRPVISPARRGDDDRVFPGVPGRHERADADLFVGIVGAGVVEVHDVLIGVDPGDDEEVVGLGALVAGLPDDGGVDPGDVLAVIGEVLRSLARYCFSAGSPV